MPLHPISLTFVAYLCLYRRLVSPVSSSLSQLLHSRFTTSNSCVSASGSDVVLAASLTAIVAIDIEVSFSYTSYVYIVSVLNGMVFFMDFVCLFCVSNKTSYLLFVFYCLVVFLFSCFLYLHGSSVQ